MVRRCVVLGSPGVRSLLPDNVLCRLASPSSYMSSAPDGHNSIIAVPRQLASIFNSVPNIFAAAGQAAMPGDTGHVAAGFQVAASLAPAQHLHQVREIIGPQGVGRMGRDLHPGAELGPIRIAAYQDHPVRGPLSFLEILWTVA